MIQTDPNRTPTDLTGALSHFFELAGPKLRRLHARWDPAQGTPVFTMDGRYTTRGWTEWTQGFQYGCMLLQFEATGDEAYLELGRELTLERMGPHLTHTGVHDHGFNTISTYGNLRRLARTGACFATDEALATYELAIQVSGATQAARWTTLEDGSGFVPSFNGPHSLFSDTIRSCRVMVLADRLGHVLMGEHDERIGLLGRAMQHLANTARYNVYYGTGRDHYDLRGRVVHESLFNVNDGRYRCPSTQQGYSPFSTWTRGLAWVVLGAAEQLEFFDALDEQAYAPYDPDGTFLEVLREMACAAADFYIAHTPTCGVPYWDTGAPGLARLGDYLDRPAEPDNPHEPVDSSAAAITAQGLLRLGDYLGRTSTGRPYWEAGLQVAATLFAPPYLSEVPEHEGLLLHTVYHRPNGWDYIPPGKHVPQGESALWGDYHAMELAVYLVHAAQDKATHFFD